MRLWWGKGHREGHGLSNSSSPCLCWGQNNWKITTSCSSGLAVGKQERKVAMIKIRQSLSEPCWNLDPGKWLSKIEDERETHTAFLSSLLYPVLNSNSEGFIWTLGRCILEKKNPLLIQIFLRMPHPSLLVSKITCW